ncbi:MAG: glycosyltransferase, partial [Clostridia bacterium]|nr:glycosyltransferase [Clostridia bacterium]
MESNSRILLSFVLPIYNVEKYIEECVDSILSQMTDDCEIILVDDGATDSSGQICDEYAARDFRIRVVHKENGG